MYIIFCVHHICLYFVQVVCFATFLFDADVPQANVLSLGDRLFPQYILARSLQNIHGWFAKQTIGIRSDVIL